MVVKDIEGLALYVEAVRCSVRDARRERLLVRHSCRNEKIESSVLEERGLNHTALNRDLCTTSFFFPVFTKKCVMKNIVF